MTWSRFAAVTALALALLAEGSGVSGQEVRARPLPPGVTACDFGALANDHTRAGPKIRAEPPADPAILGRLPMIENVYHENIAAALPAQADMQAGLLAGAGTKRTA